MPQAFLLKFLYEYGWHNQDSQLDFFGDLHDAPHVSCISNPQINVHGLLKNFWMREVQIE